jgi:hypothetical protein
MENKKIDLPCKPNQLGDHHWIVEIPVECIWVEQAGVPPVGPSYAPGYYWPTL